jgi:hypothetical protein
MTTAQQSKTLQAADVLDKAADHLERVGHHKGYLYDERQAKGAAIESCRVCAVGAILVAAHGKPRYPDDEPLVGGISDLAILALTDHVDGPVPTWNDEPDRTADEVVTAMRQTAKTLREAA